MTMTTALKYDRELRARDNHGDLPGSRLFLKTELTDAHTPLYIITRHTSRRGMSRELDFLFIRPAGRDVDIQTASLSVACVLDLDRSRRGAVICRESPEIVIARLGELLFGDPNSIQYRTL